MIRYCGKLCLFVSIACGLVAAEDEKKELILELQKVNNLHLVVEALRNENEAIMRDGFAKRLGDGAKTPEGRRLIERVMQKYSEQMADAFDIRRIEKAAVEFFSARMTTEDLKAVLAFNRSTIGQLMIQCLKESLMESQAAAIRGAIEPVAGTVHANAGNRAGEPDIAKIKEEIHDNAARKVGVTLTDAQFEVLKKYEESDAAKAMNEAYAEFMQVVEKIRIERQREQGKQRDIIQESIAEITVELRREGKIQ